MAAYISVNKLPSNNDNNKTKYLIVRQNQHDANRLYITYMGNQASTFLFFVWKILDYHSFWLFWRQVFHIFGIRCGRINATKLIRILDDTRDT